MSESTSAASGVPKITTLRTLLTYGGPSDGRTQHFNEVVRGFRKNYSTPSGRLGADLHDWKSEIHQSELSLMAHAFLEEHNHGKNFWPDAGEHGADAAGLEYSKNQEFIRSTIKQLFFRLNQQQFRNQKYKKKDIARSQTLDADGWTANQPITVEDDSPGSLDIEKTSKEAGSHVPKVTVLKMPGKSELPRKTALQGLHARKKETKTNKGKDWAKRFSAEDFDFEPSPSESEVDTRQQPQAAKRVAPEPQESTSPSNKRPKVQNDKPYYHKSPNLKFVAQPRTITRTSLRDRPTKSPIQDFSFLDQLEQPTEDHGQDDGVDGPSGNSSDADTNAHLPPEAGSHASPGITRRDLNATVESAPATPEEQGFRSSFRTSDFRPWHPPAPVAVMTAPATAPARAAPRAPQVPQAQNQARETVASRAPQASDSHEQARDRTAARAPQASQAGERAGGTTTSTPTVLQQPSPAPSLEHTQARAPSAPQEPGATVPGPSAGDSANVHVKEREGKSATPNLAQKSKVDFVYRVVKSRDPFFDYDVWHPKGGRFQDKTLEEVVRDLPDSCLSRGISALKFTLEGPGARGSDMVRLHDEMAFTKMKAAFKRQIMACLSKAAGSLVLMDMEIEPLYEDEQDKDKKVEDAEDDLDW